MSEPLGKLLVVDDESEICDVLGDFFEGKGYEVVKALTGIEAIERFKRERPDLVLLDIKMPVMDGVEVFKRLREIDPSVGVIMVTANEDVELARQLLEQGAFDYVAKPFDFDYLDRAVVARMMEEKKKGNHYAADLVYALTLEVFRAVRSIPAEGQESPGKQLESAALSVLSGLLDSDYAGALKALAETELLLWLARDLGDLKKAAFDEVEARLQAAREALGGAGS
jgi:two-component system response regulator (stage 0 sporulation protein F)